MVQHIPVSHQRPKSPLITLLMFDIDDITSMFANISIVKYKYHLCSTIACIYVDAQVMKGLKLIISSYRNI